MNKLFIAFFVLFSCAISAQPNTEIKQADVSNVFYKTKVEQTPKVIVQKQVDTYNSGNLDAFVNCFSEDVVARRFPKDTLYTGHKNMRINYKGLSPKTITYQAEVVNRITLKNKVVDLEKITGNGREQMQIAIYEINNDLISSVDFIFDVPKAPNPETIVQQQLNAYNARNIKAFLETYTDDIKTFKFPNESSIDGKTQMRESFSKMFDKVPNLYCEIKNRIVLGNKVIDHEHVRFGDKYSDVIAISEVENGKIAKVTFLK